MYKIQIIVNDIEETLTDGRWAYCTAIDRRNNSVCSVAAAAAAATAG